MWGELMVIDTVLPTAVSPATVTGQTPAALTAPGSSTVPHTDHPLQPFGPQAGPLTKPTVFQTSPTTASALPNSVAAGNQVQSGTGSSLANPGSGSGSGTGPNLAKAGSGSGSPDVMPKKEEEYYDDSELSGAPPERYC